MKKGSEKKRPTRVKKMPQKFCLEKNMYSIRLAYSAGIGGFIYGYYSGLFYDILLPYARHKFDRGIYSYSEYFGIEQEIIITIDIVASSMLGAFISGCENDRIGRRGVLSVASFFFILGAINIVCTANPRFLKMGLWLMGSASGMTFTTSPLYIAEISPSSVSGAFVSTYSLQIMGGKILCYLLIPSTSGKEYGIWQRILGLVLVIIQSRLWKSLPESPTWLYRKGKKKEAVETLMKIHNNSGAEVAKVVNSICLSVETERTIEGLILHGDNIIHPSQVYVSACKNVPNQRLIASIGCQVVQQLVGFNFIMYHSPIIVDHLLHHKYVTSNKMILTTYLLITSILCAFGSIISITFFVDRYKRRRLIVTSIFGIITCLSLLSYLFYVSYATTNSNERKEDNNPIMSLGFGLLGTVTLGFYFIFYSLGIGTVSWILNLELYSLRYRSACGGMTIAVHVISIVLVNLLFTCLNDKFGMNNTLIMLLMCSSVSGLIIYLYLPETNGIVEEDGMLLQLDNIVQMTQNMV